VLSARKGFVQRADCLGITEEEKAFWNSLPDSENVIEKYQIGKYNMDEKELPVCMEKYGFSNISVGYAVINLTPDNPQYEKDFAKEIILAEKSGDLDAIQRHDSPYKKNAISAINKKYETRLAHLEAQEHQWDTYTSITMVVRGVK